ncbi:ArgS-related anticodon-binding protein NrtL [Streptomyces bullii]|uniref:arginine--tRNA ligase n=1 Tax=Streptomyces bullii TaxID=349910 RepID=A0ABW0UNI5_9ACTN
MTPVELSRTVLHAVRRAVDDGELSVTVPQRAVVAPPGPGGCGDYATTIALQLSRPAGQLPRRVAEILRPRLAGLDGIADVVVTGPGFLNISLRDAAPAALVREILRDGTRYGHATWSAELTELTEPADRCAAAPAGQTVETAQTAMTLQAPQHFQNRRRNQNPWPNQAPQPNQTPAPNHAPHPPQTLTLHSPHEVRAIVVMDALARILRSQGVLVRTAYVARPEPEWEDLLGVRAEAGGRPDAPAHAPVSVALDVDVRPVPAPADPLPLGRDAARWALLHPAPHDRPRITDDHLVQRESNPLFRVRYAHARTRALTRNAADLGFGAEPGPVALRAGSAVAGVESLVAALGDHPRVLAHAAAHRRPDRLARHLVTVADAVLPLLPAVLPLGEEKPSAAHRARLALAEAAGTVLAGGLSLLGIDAPDHL